MVRVYYKKIPIYPMFYLNKGTTGFGLLLGVLGGLAYGQMRRLLRKVPSILSSGKRAPYYQPEFHEM